MEKDLSLDEVISIALAMEISNSERRLASVGEVNFVSNRDSRKTDQKTCFACGRRVHIATSSECVARGKNCHKCGRMGHF